MKRATGSNPPQTANKVSIQLALDGHSFSVRFPAGDIPAEGIAAEVLTPRTLLVPEELLDRARAAELLSAAGLTARADERAVCTEAQAGVAALMAVPAEALQQVAERCKGAIRFTTPLLEEPQKKDATIWLHRTAGLVYIKVYRTGALRFGEVVPAAEDADAVYLLERVATEFPPREYALYLTGDSPRKLSKSVGNAFKEIVCG